MEPSKVAYDLIAKWEGCRLTSYRDGKGYWTIGIGHLMRPQDDVACAGVVINLTTAGVVFHEDVDEAAQVVAKLTDLTQPMLDALTSFVFAFGASKFYDSELFGDLMDRKYQAAADQLLRWDHEGTREVAGLEERRKEERALFLSGLKVS